MYFIDITFCILYMRKIRYIFARISSLLVGGFINEIIVKFDILFHLSSSFTSYDNFKKLMEDTFIIEMRNNIVI